MLKTVKDSSVSVRLYELLKAQLVENRFLPGHRFFSERELSMKYDVARLTARRVILRLISEDHLRSEPGKGTFVISKGRTGKRRVTKAFTHCVILVAEPFDASKALVELSLFGPLQRIAAESGYHVALASSQRARNTNSPIPYQSLAEKQRADGYLLASVDPRVHRWFDVRGYPCVVLGSCEKRITIPCVRSCDENYFDSAVRHLHGLGHTRIACLGRGGSALGRRMRVASFRLALKKYGLNAYTNVFLVNQDRELEYRHAVRRLLRRNPPPTAIIVYRDVAAAYALSELIANGLRVPEDVSLIAGSDCGIAELLHPKLTTVAEPLNEIVKAAWDYLLDQCVRGVHLRNQAKVIEPKLILRESTGQVKLRNLLRSIR
ncbi:MAG: GntR family transcriptional regulator [Acidobacteria bacterium]|nr:GntR family transcriptional regulator [Acidobacteriota bacterium]